MVTNKEVYREFEGGWNGLFDALIGELDALPIVIEVTQAKEKYALLRVYYTIQDKNEDYRTIIDTIIEKYSSVSGHTCIVCGSTLGVNQRYINDYMVTICEDCYAKETGWFTQADCIEDFESLSESQKSYRLSQKIWLDPAIEILREANKKDGISYVVSVGGNNFRFYHIEDAWKFSVVRDRAYCDYLYFVGTLASGLVWNSGDVEVYMEHKGGK